MENLLIAKLIVLAFVLIFVWVIAKKDNDSFYDRREDEEVEDHLERLTSTSKKDGK